MIDAGDDDFSKVVIDAVEDAVGALACGPQAREVSAQRIADPARVGDQCCGEEVDDSCGDWLGQVLLNDTPGRWGDYQFVGRLDHRCSRRTACEQVLVDAQPLYAA